MGDPTVIAVDWSGAKTRPKGIWITAIANGQVIRNRPATSREEAIDDVTSTEGPVVAGFDFSFGVPEWFAREQGCSAIDDVWKLAERDGEKWLGPPPTPPFWRDECIVPPERRLRRCEEGIGAKSVFQCVGNGQVGPGSVRGMPLLLQLRDAGFAIWPFDAASDRMVVEIYPSALRKLIDEPGPFESDDERDAVCSALVMWRERETIAALGAAIDPVTRLEGDVWLPTLRT
jgi:hypothetical protein